MPVTQRSAQARGSRRGAALPTERLIAPAAAARAADRVPVEFVGLARQLWRRVDREYRKVEPAQDALIAGLRDCLPRRGFRPRAATTPAEFITAWEALPSLGRLGLNAEVDRRGVLHLVELRCAPGKMRMDRWGDGADAELAIAVLLIAVDYKPRKALATKRTPLADACHHALARRYERGTDRSDDAVLRDLFALAQHWGTAVREPEFEIPAPSGGTWVGERVRLGARPYLTARTFVGAR